MEFCTENSLQNYRERKEWQQCGDRCRPASTLGSAKQPEPLQIGRDNVQRAMILVGIDKE